VFPLVIACGSRTPLDLPSLGNATPDDGVDASTPEPPDTKPEPVPNPLPLPGPDPDPIPEPPPDPSGRPRPSTAGVCYGDFTKIRNTTCEPPVRSAGTTCRGSVTCNEQTLKIACRNGHCRCDNPGFDNPCYCDMPKETTDACGDVNCCWR
jgi:hypothetical protein